MKKTILLLLIIGSQVLVKGQSEPFVTLPDQLNDDSFAEWIAPENETGMGVYYFRKKLVLEVAPDQFIIHVSADNRYRLFVNGAPVSWGPAVGDLLSWNYETIDIASFLKTGKNILAAQVWNMGPLRGARQITHKTAFILQGETGMEQVANSNHSWLVKKDEGYHWIPITSEIAGGGYIAGGSDSLDGGLHSWEWNLISFDDSDWKAAKESGKGNHSGLDTWKGTPWLLQARTIPLMEQTPENIPGLLYAHGTDYPIDGYDGSLDLNIPSNTHVELLLDNHVLTMGFPQLSVSGGGGSRIKIQYQEALFDGDGNKGNRNEWQGKEMKGYYDVFMPDGDDRMFEPLWIRVFRYVKITIDTKQESLRIYDFHNLFTAYPLVQKASFQSDDESLGEIWNVSWRTARLCALETYMDCPYYEQLQYIGDTRIQALLSMYIAGEDRLAKSAINQFYNSMQPMGLTQSRYPADGTQIIPPFSLLFIGMVHDYHMLRDDPEFIRQYIPGIRFILDWFINKIDESGMLGPLPYWNHIDGGTKFMNGSPPGISGGGSAHMTILLAYAIDRAVEIFEMYEYKCDADHLRMISSSLKENTLKHCFDKQKGLIAETPSKKVFSQHTNSFAILTNMLDEETERAVARKVMDDPELIQATLYFNFYIFQALKKAGLGGEIVRLMDKWTNFLDYGFTTFPEHGIESRSDCHAWSAHPMYDFLNITCGIGPAAPGFKKVMIRPQPGRLLEMRGVVPHPSGEISVTMNRDTKGTAHCIIELPEGLDGTFIYGNNAWDITGGKSEFNVDIQPDQQPVNE